MKIRQSGRDEAFRKNTVRSILQPRIFEGFSMNHRRTPLVFAVVFSLTVCFAFTSAPQPQPRTDIEKRISALLSRMTLEEKLGQLQQLDGEANGNFRPEHPDMIRKGLLGSTLNVRGVARTNELQRIAMTESRLQIPVLFAFEVIYGC